MPRCPSCANDLPPGATACPRCGAPVTGAPLVATAGGARPAAPAARAPAAVWRPATPRHILVRLVVGVVGVLLFGCTALLVVGSVPDPVALALSALAAVVPAACYSLLILTVDRYEHEPWRVLLGAFGWGAVVAALFSALANTLTGTALSAAYGPDLGPLLNLGLGAPLIEESFKGAALLGLLLVLREEFDNVLDGLVYGALIGLGFAMTENILYFGQAYLSAGLAGLGQLFLARAIIGGLGHALYTGTTGAAIGWARGRHGRGALRFVVPVAGWALAVFQHLLWNTGAVAIAALRGANASVLAVVAPEAALFTLPGVLVLVAVAVVAGRREAAIIRDQLAEEVAAGLLTPAAYATLTSPAARRRAALAAYRAGGLARWGLLQRFFQAAAELAFRKYHRAQGEAPKGDQRWTSEQEYRGLLAALGRQLGDE
ncbi:MAG TPA: PrsW family glutamic-type intramembrane protease [Thermomicrobiales bacterium]|nr:PrsW family glutamic-type intramembrane protease [Thermomicrobiales bacterium]